MCKEKVDFICEDCGDYAHEERECPYNEAQERGEYE